MKKEILIFILSIILHSDLFSQSVRDDEIKIVNDILPELLGENTDCLYLYEKNGFALLRPGDFDRFINRLDTIIEPAIASELLIKATDHPDKNGVWNLNEIENVILLSKDEIWSKIYKFIYSDSIYGVSSDKPDCHSFEILLDSTNISMIINPLTGEIIVDTLDYYKQTPLVPEEFFKVFFINKPFIDKSGKYAILSYGTNPFTLRGFGCSYLCEKINDKWTIIHKFNSFAS
jgi:hypothetical protein